MAGLEAGLPACLALHLQPYPPFFSCISSSLPHRSLPFPRFSFLELSSLSLPGCIIDLSWCQSLLHWYNGRYHKMDRMITSAIAVITLDSQNTYYSICCGERQYRDADPYAPVTSPDHPMSRDVTSPYIRGLPLLKAKWHNHNA